MRVLVTGAGGFIGGHLLLALADSGPHELHGMVRPDGAAPRPIPASLRVHAVDIRNADEVDAMVRVVRPDRIYHLAARSLPESSWQAPAETFDINLRGTIHLLEAMRRHAPEARMLLVASSAVYAASPEGSPLVEGGLLHPSSLYGVSKLAAEEAGVLYARRYGLHVVCCRPFFLTGPGKRGDVSSDLCRRVVEAEKAGGGVLRTGRLEVVRDVMDVRDGVSAMELLAERGEKGVVYNICTGRGVSVREIAAVLLRLARVSLEAREDSALLRLIDEPVKIGDPSRLAALGWKPARDLQTTLAEMLDYWRHEEGGWQCRS